MPPARDAPQLLVSAKSLVADMEEIARAVVPELCSVTAAPVRDAPTGCDTKVRDVGLTLACWDVPWPLSARVCGLPGAVSVTVRIPVRLPRAVGVKVTLTVQLVPGATGVPQVFDWAKSPVIWSEVIVKGPVPLLLT